MIKTTLTKQLKGGGLFFDLQSRGIYYGAREGMAARGSGEILRLLSHHKSCRELRGDSFQAHSFGALASVLE